MSVMKNIGLLAMKAAGVPQEVLGIAESLLDSHKPDTTHIISTIMSYVVATSKKTIDKHTRETAKVGKRDIVWLVLTAEGTQVLAEVRIQKPDGTEVQHSPPTDIIPTIEAEFLKIDFANNSMVSMIFDFVGTINIEGQRVTDAQKGYLMSLVSNIFANPRVFLEEIFGVMALNLGLLRDATEAEFIELWTSISCNGIAIQEHHEAYSTCFDPTPPTKNGKPENRAYVPNAECFSFLLSAEEGYFDNIFQELLAEIATTPPESTLPTTSKGLHLPQDAYTESQEADSEKKFITEKINRLLSN